MSCSIEFRLRGRKSSEEYADPNRPEVKRLLALVENAIKEGGSLEAATRLVQKELDAELWIVRQEHSNSWLSRLRRLGSRHSVSFPVAWELFAFLLPKQVRQRVYEPAQQELLEDYLLRRRFLASPWASRWLAFCFTIRTAVLWGQSLYAWGGSGLAKTLKWIIGVILGRQALDALRGVLFRLFY